MSRYGNSGSTGSDSSSGDYDDDTILKLQKYAAISLTPNRVSAFESDWGDRFVAAFEDVEVLDGVVFRREDKPGTWKVFSAGKWFNLNEENGLVYESYDADADDYSGQMTAEDILQHPYILGFQEEFGGDDYYYEPIGVVIEEAGDVALNSDIVGVENGLTESEAQNARSETKIPVGDASMLLGNKAWVRTFAKKFLESGEAAIDSESKYDNYGWLATSEPEIRSEIEDRTLELWITERPVPEESDSEQDTFTAPSLMDSKTGQYVTIDNGLTGSDNPETEQQTEDTDESEPESAREATEEQAEAAADGGEQKSDEGAESGGAMDGNVPDELDDLIDYLAKTQGTVDAGEVREFAEGEVSTEVDWEAAAAEVNSRA